MKRSHTDLRETLRTAYNRVFYFAAGLCLPSSAFLPDANGWTLTYRKGECVYKRFNLPFLFHPYMTFRGFLAFHRELTARGITRYIPPFRVGASFIAYAFIPRARQFDRALLAASPEERRTLLREAFKLTDYFHSNGIIHGDLKPKNILVAEDGSLWAIDFENARFSASDTDRGEDYRKLLSRIAYFFTAEELRAELEEAGASQTLRAYARRYLEPFRIREILDGMPGLVFELTQDVPDEDVDLSIPDATYVPHIVGRIEGACLDWKLFFRSRNDIKLYVYNLSGMTELDIHLVKPLGRFEFLKQKRAYPPVQISITGPDGAGKTALISAFSNYSGPLLGRIPIRVVHASRFVREGREAPSRWTFQARAVAHVRSSLWYRRLAYARLLQRDTHPLILLDRSFYDPFIQRTVRNSLSIWGVRTLIPSGIWSILLVASPATIRSRKPELSQEEVETYYRRAEMFLPSAARVDAEGSIEETCLRLDPIIRYYVLTNDAHLR